MTRRHKTTACFLSYDKNTPEDVCAAKGRPSEVDKPDSNAMDEEDDIYGDIAGIQPVFSM